MSGVKADCMSVTQQLNIILIRNVVRKYKHNLSLLMLR